ncbi:MAG TPA: AI-2E family transporter, partial [Gaiella sp.]|nr:AI-2E family transporter [Gaiella sp.]
MPQATTIRIPRWIQLVGLPVVLLLAFLLARTLGHVLFLFLTAAVIAFTLNPLVRELTSRRLPRGLAVALVSTLFATVFIGIIVALGTVVVSETRSGAERIDAYLTEESPASGQTGVEVDVDRLQAWLDDHGLEQIQIREQVNEWLDGLSAGEISGYAQ